MEGGYQTVSRTIDEKVVEMRFDNKQFESNVATSLSTLDKLKQSLNLTGASKGLEDINSAAKKVDMSGIATGVETVGLKFNWLYSVADQALRNITTSAMNTGKRIISALTIDPVKTGFSEYETKINAIQTIMSNTASKGTTMDDVTRVINELNTYADKTIYNFAEMTRNIGTFTAAGVGLEDSATAIQGIANLAAASGSNSQQASTAMYQLSQALSTGTVRLMDWNSVVNAGMGGEKFQEALKATAREHGVAVDDIIEKNGSFRESLSDGWLTAEILNTTLKKFTTGGAKEYAQSMIEAGKWTQKEADALAKQAQEMEDAATKVKTFTQLWDTLKESAQSGWSQTWEIIVGDFEEAKETLTKFSEVIGGIIGKSADARNELLQGWKDAGGRTHIIDGIYNMFDAVLSVVKPIKEAFREIFPPTTVEQLVGLTEGFKEFTERLKLSETASKNLKRTFKGLFAIVDIVKEVFSAAFKAIGSLFGIVGDFGGGILDVTARIGDMLVKFRDLVKSSGLVNATFQKIAAIIKTVLTVAKTLIGKFAETFVAPGFEAFFTLLEKIRAGASELGNAIHDAMRGAENALANCSLFKILKAIWNGVTILATAIGNLFKSLVGGLANVISTFNLETLIELLNMVLAGGILAGIQNFSNAFKNIGDVIDNAVGIIDDLGTALQSFITNIRAGTLEKIARAIAILAVSVLVLSMIDRDKLENALGAIAALFTELMVAMAVFSKISGYIKGALMACFAMNQIAISVLVLSLALRTIADLDMEELKVGLLGVAGLLGLVVATMKLMGSCEKTVMKGATQIVIFAAAIKILASACEDLSALSFWELKKGLVGVGALMAAVSLFLNETKFKREAVQTATGIVLLAAAMKVLASACEDFSNMSWPELWKGLKSIAVLLAEIAMFTELTKNSNRMLSSGVALIAISAAMKIFASAMDDLAGLSRTDILKGLVSMAASLVMITLALNRMPEDLAGKGVGLIAVAAALLILSTALERLGGMSWESIGRGITLLGASMLILAVGLDAMKGTAGGTAALVFAVTALGLFVPVLLVLGSTNWKVIASGLTTIAAAFLIVGVAGKALASVAPAIFMVAAALAIVGVAILAAGVGMMAFGAGLSAVAVGLVSLVSALAAIASELVIVIVAVIKGVLTGIAEGIVAFCEIISKGAPAIGAAIKAIVLTICDVLVECIPAIVDAILQLVSGLLDSLVKYTPKIVDALFDFVIGLIDGLAKRTPELIKSLVNLVMSVFQGCIDALGQIDPNTLIKGILAVGLMAGVMAALAAISGLIPAAMLGVLGMGLVVAELAIVLAAIGALAQIPGLNWLIGEGGELLKNIGRAIGGFVGGIVGGIAEGITSALPQIGTDLSDFMNNIQPFIDGAKSIDEAAMSGVKSLVGVILALTGASIIDSMTSWLTGGASLSEFGDDLAAFGPKMKAYADSVSGMDISAVQTSVEAAKALTEMAATIPNEGGMVAWFTGDNSVAKFADQLPNLGNGLKSFSDSVAGIAPESMIAATTAAKALADLASVIPNQGGLVAWFVGDNSVAKFGEDLIQLGVGLKGFSMAIMGIAPESMIAAANAAKVLADMTATIPNQGGVVAWFAGDNSISKFGEDLANLGNGLKGFSVAIEGVVPENLTAAAGAAKALAEMTAVIPNRGGIASWFAGDNSISKFGGELIALGIGLKGFSVAVMGIVPENITAAANAAKSLAEMATVIPNEGGMVAWFKGENSIAKFAGDLTLLGIGLKSFSVAVTGIVPENITGAAQAAKALAEMTAVLPNEGGVVAWFKGEASISKFSGELVQLGIGLKGFSVAITGIAPENITAAANAAKALAEMTAIIPTEGGIKAWFTGETSIAKFAVKLPALGMGLKGFSDSVKGISPENTTAAAAAARDLGEMTGTIPKNTDKIADFGDNIVSFGGKLQSYFSKTSGISSESVAASTTAINAVKSAAELDTGKVKSLADAIDDVVDAVKGLSKINKSAARDFKSAIEDIGKTGADALVEPFEDIDEDMKKAGKKAIEAFVNGVEAKLSSAKKSCKSVASDCADAIEDKKSAFKTTGKQLVQGFADGIDANTFKAEAKAKAMAKAALEAAKKVLKIKSPSKEAYKLGNFTGLGYVNALGMYADKAYDAGYEMAIFAKNGLRDAISRVGDVVNSEMDTEPTIRPVLDLSGVRSGVSAIGSLFNRNSSVGVLASVGGISSMMNRRSQNGANSDVVSEIAKLRKEIGNVGGTTYQINGVTYDDGSNIADAVQAIVRAARVERRK